MEEISATRFNAIAGYARHPRARLTGEEIKYYEATDGELFGLIVRDRQDGDYTGMVMGPDRKMRFRWTSMTPFFESLGQAVAALGKLMDGLLDAPDDFHHQDDEEGVPVDFFTPLHGPEALHPDFRSQASEAGYSSARGITEPMMRWHENLDGNFVEQFQSIAFDQRMWELYLFAMLTELGYMLDGSHARFRRTKSRGPNRDRSDDRRFDTGGKESRPSAIDGHDHMAAYLQHYMPIKFGSTLFSKLKKKYWNPLQVTDMPLVFAIADFSSPGSMLQTCSALERYLYGLSYEIVRDEQGTAACQPKKIAEHRWGINVIPSGFFDIPDAKHVSAVISTTAGTTSKFDRLGVLAGFRRDDVLMGRTGTCVDHDPSATRTVAFRAIVNAEGYDETWVEGLDVFHNPRADVALPEHFLPGAAQHHCDSEGHWTSSVPSFHPLVSKTEILCGADVTKFLSEFEGPAIKVTKVR